MNVVDIGSRFFVYPNECPCCGGTPDSELMILFKPSSRTMSEDTARRVLFPYCRPCIDHVGTWDAGSMTSSLVTLGGILGGVAVGLLSGARYGLLVFGGALAIAAFVASIIQSRARAACLPSCASAARGVVYYGWSGSTSTFAFASPTYAAHFVEQSVAVPPRPLGEWIEHIEAQPSRVARRIALTSALSTLSDDDARSALVFVVCRAELAPLFDEIDGLPRSAQKRRIERAIAEVRADNMPELLRDAQLHELARKLT